MNLIIFPTQSTIQKFKWQNRTEAIHTKTLNTNVFFLLCPRNHNSLFGLLSISPSLPAMFMYSFNKENYRIRWHTARMERAFCLVNWLAWDVDTNFIKFSSHYSLNLLFSMETKVKKWSKELKKATTTMVIHIGPNIQIIFHWVLNSTFALSHFHSL